MSDFLFTDHGSLVVLTPLTEAAQQWASEHLPQDALRWDRGIVIEPRYFDDIADGIAAEGLTIN